MATDVHEQIVNNLTSSEFFMLILTSRQQTWQTIRHNFYECDDGSINKNMLFLKP